MYPLYAVWFVERGLSDGQISALFALWSFTAILTEVPTGALADRWSRRGAVVLAGALQAAAYVVWVVHPSFTGFAAGFVLWGLGGSLASGALEALLYDHLLAVGAHAEFTRINGRLTTAGLVSQLPATLLATGLFAIGGFTAAGLGSAVLCLAAALVATRLPHDLPRADADADDAGYLRTMCDGVAQIGRIPGLRYLVIAVATVEAIDTFEEYFPLLAAGWSVPTHLNPPAVLLIALAGACGATIGGRSRGTLRPLPMAGGLALAAAMLVVADVWHRPPAVALVAVFYGTYCAVSTILQGTLQHRIRGPHRATVTSAVGFVTELSAFAVYAAWAIGGPRMVAVLVIVAAGVVGGLGRAPRGSRRSAK